MTLPHENILEDDHANGGTWNNAIVEVIQNFRSSHAAIKLARVINFVLTFLFGYRYMGSIFNLFGEMTESAEIFAGVLAGLALVALFDLPYHAWNAIAQRPGLSSEQIATAETAAQYSLYGSLAASIAAIVLSQNLITLPESINFIATGAGLIAVALIAIFHMKWWHDFNKESFDAKQRAEIASHTARKLTIKIRQEKEIAALEAQQQQRQHQLNLLKLEAEQELEYQKMLAEAEIRKELLQQKIEQKRAVAAQVKVKGKAKINEVSDRIIEHETDSMVDEFLVDFGLPVSDRNSSKNGANGHPKLN